MKAMILACGLLVAGKAKAQKGMDGLIGAEQKFAASSVDSGMRYAFLHALDTNAVVFENAQPTSALKTWTQREKRPGILNWRPQFAEVSASLDFGYTTGPWTFQPKTLKDSIAARGQYMTVWHLDERGEWKFLVDLGVGNTPANSDYGIHRIGAEKKKTLDPQMDSVLAVEADFIAIFQKRMKQAYATYLSASSILNRNNSLPALQSDAQSEIINATPAQMKLEVLGWGIASSNDLAYVYGTARAGEKIDNFLHIWRREAGGWKLALEVLRY